MNRRHTLASCVRGRSGATRTRRRAVDESAAPEAFAALKWFGAERTARESERGGAGLNLPETRVVAEPGGYLLERDPGLEIEDWNAHVSLLTGMAAADIMLRGGVGILRTMPPAAPEDIAER